MKCERCGESPAEMSYTEIHDGKAQKLRICANCARSLGFETDAPAGALPAAPAKLVGAITVTAKGTARPESPLDAVSCPACGTSGVELRTRSLFGCPKCYEVFDELLDPVLRRLHGAVHHRGRLPHGVTAEPADADRLRRDLKEAIRDEDFERAARVRDRLRHAMRPVDGTEELP